MSLLDDYVNVGAGQLGGLDSMLDASPVVEGDGQPHTNGASSMTGMFRIDQVTLPGSLSIVGAAVQNNILFIALANVKLMRIDLSEPAEILDIDISQALSATSSKSSERDSIHKIHLDATGQHLIITTTKGENVYWHSKNSKPAKLSKLKGVIESVGWNNDGNKHSTKEILVGLRSGSVYETWLEPTEGFTRSLERYCKLVYSIESGSPVHGLYHYMDAAKHRHILLASDGALLHFAGVLPKSSSADAPILTAIFADNAPGEHACQGSKSILRTVADKDAESHLHFAWACVEGILHGDGPVNPGEASFEGATMLPATGTENILLTAYHIIALRDGELCAFNRFDHREVYREALTSAQSVLGLVSDAAHQTYWCYTESHLYEIVVSNEARDLWSVFLKAKNFEKASRFAESQRQQDVIHEAQARSHLEALRYDEAAKSYARASTPVEQVALALLDREERDALRLYLQYKLELSRKAAGMQRTMLATWIVELFMNKMNALDDLQNIADGLRKDAAIGETAIAQISNDFRQFVKQYTADMDKETIYALISSYGRDGELLAFAESVNDYRYVVHHHIARESYAAALNQLIKHPDVDLIYETANVLLPEVPQQAVEFWMKLGALDPERVLPAVLLYSTRQMPALKDNQAVRFLQFAIRNKGDRCSQAIHNALVGIYARDCDKDEAELLAYLSSRQTPAYDTDFALRQCREHGRVISCIRIFSSIGMHEQALDLALQHDNFDLAKQVANGVESLVDGSGNGGTCDGLALKKKFWLRIAQTTMERRGIQAAIELSKETDVLRVEDLLPSFTDETPLDELKEEICAALERYANQIRQLQTEMDYSSRATETLEKAMTALDRRFAVIHTHELCYHCDEPLIGKDTKFYVFPCQHVFHSECLVQLALRDSSASQRRRIAQLQLRARPPVSRTKSPAPSTQQKSGNTQTAPPIAVSRTSSLAMARVPSSATGSSSTKDHGSSGRGQGQGPLGAGGAEVPIEEAKAREALDEIIAADCPLCGERMISSIDWPLFDAADKNQAAEAASWIV
ncbi:tethering complex subunit [Savitreella phatthalungensis]